MALFGWSCQVLIYFQLISPSLNSIIIFHHLISIKYYYYILTADLNFRYVHKLSRYIQQCDSL